RLVESLLPPGEGARSADEGRVPELGMTRPRVQSATAMKQTINVAQYGIGPIGAEIARLLLTKPWVRLVAAVDIDPNKIGRDVGEVIAWGKETGVKVTADLPSKVDVVCHSTGSRLRDVSGQLKDLLSR